MLPSLLTAALALDDKRNESDEHDEYCKHQELFQPKPGRGEKTPAQERGHQNTAAEHEEHRDRDNRSITQMNPDQGQFGRQASRRGNLACEGKS